MVLCANLLMFINMLYMCVIIYSTQFYDTQILMVKMQMQAAR